MTYQLSPILRFKTAVRFFLCLAMAVILAPVSPFNPRDAGAVEEIYVKVLVARVRQAPTTEAPILFRARRGDPVVVEKKRNEWYYIRYPDGRTGWAHRDLFAAPSDEGRRSAEKSHFIKTITSKIVSENRETVAFELNGFYPPETFVLKGERPRVVCDFLNTRIDDNIGDRIESEGSLIKGIRVAPYGGVAARVRIVLDLSRDRHYEIDQTFYKKENIYLVTVSTAVP